MQTHPDSAPQSHKDPTLDELRQEAAIQRSRVASDIETLGRKVSPENLKAEAKEAVKDAGRSTVRAVVDGAEQVVDTGRRAGEGALTFVRRNPVAFGMIAAGVGMLAYSARSPESKRRNTSSNTHPEASRMRQVAKELEEKAEHKYEQTRNALDEWSHTATDVAQAATRDAVSFYERQPLAVAAATLAAGAAVGLMLPKTGREDELFGAKRDELADRAKVATREGLREAEVKLTQAAEHVGTNVRDRV